MHLSRRPQTKSVRRLIVAAVTTTVAALGLITVTSQTAQADVHRIPQYAHGCPAYAVCFYPNGTWNNDHPSFYYNFQSERGVHYWSNLHDVYGIHRVFNNGIDVENCTVSEVESLTLNTGYNGGGSHTYLLPGHYLNEPMDPIDSITLWHDYYSPNLCLQGS